MKKRFTVAALALGATAATLVATAATAAPKAAPAVLDDSQMTPSTTVIGGADVLPTTKTVAHWWGSSVDPTDGVTYGYNMVGANPYTCSGSDCSTTIETDVIPINVTVGGMAFNGTDVLQATLASPQFTNEDYTTTPHATSASGGYNSGGALSAGNVGVQLQDATMRSQFNKVGNSPYHVMLNPTVRPTINVDIPANHGLVLRNSRGVNFADVDVQWWATKLQNLISSLGYMDPTHLPIFLTNGVMLYVSSPGNCCIIGFHGASIVPGNSDGSVHNNGNAPVQTYAWASYITPGTFNPVGGWAVQDIHALSHEIAEWGDDPFVNNYVQPWLTPTAPQYGCTGILETGDPVVGIGFSMGTNTYDQSSVYADGTYHPEDEVFLPWFVRSTPNTTSQPTQTASTNGGRYTLMGDLNPYPGFRVPATGC